MKDSLAHHFQTMARYNTIVNQRLYGTCVRLPDANKKTREAFFGSIHATLNHLLVGDRLWLARLAGEDVPSISLDAVLYEDFGGVEGGQTGGRTSALRRLRRTSTRGFWAARYAT